MLDAFLFRAQPTGLIGVLVRLIGAGAAAPTVALGPMGRTPNPTGLPVVTRAGLGDYTITVPNPPGTLEGVFDLQGNSAPTNLTAKKVQWDHDSFVQATGAFRILVCDLATPTAIDLAVTDVLCLLLFFKATSGVS